MATLDRSDIEFISGPLNVMVRDEGFESLADIGKWIVNFLKGLKNLITDFTGTLDRVVGENTQASLLDKLNSDYDAISVIVNDGTKFSLVKDKMVRLPIGSSSTPDKMAKQLLSISRIQQACVIDMEGFSSFISRILTEDGFDSSDIKVQWKPNLSSDAMDDFNRDLLKLMNSREKEVKFSAMFKYPAALTEVYDNLKEATSDLDLHYARVDLPKYIDAEYKKFEKIKQLENRGAIELSEVRRSELYDRVDNLSALVTLYGKYVATLVNELSAISAVRTQVVG